jgi:O-antigen ligase
VVVAPALIIGLALASGGFFPDATSVATLGALAVLLVRVVLDPAAFAHPQPAAVVAIAAIAAFAAWTLLSSGWSGSASRAVLEYARVLLYAVVLVVFVSIGHSDGRARALAAAVALGCAAVGIAALGPWLMPADFPVDPGFPRGRLNWPTSYWNATGLIAALGVVLTTHLACSVRDHPAVRALGAAAAPLLVATVVFSVSRGAVAAGLVGAAGYALVGRSRGMLTGLPVVLGGGAIAAAVALGVDGLEVVRPDPPALAEGREAAAWLGVVALVTGAVRAALVPLDRRIAALRLPRARPRATRMGVAAAVVALVAVALATGAPERLGDGWHEFTRAGVVGGESDPGSRLTRLGNNGRIELWDVALHSGFEQAPMRGSGAGTFALLWERDRPSARNVLDGHSLYLEVLGELGLVGLALLLGTLVPLLGALWWRASRDRSPAWAALAAAATAWAVHAGVDWDWEMPALTAWVFCAGGLALGRPRVSGDATSTPPAGRLRTAGILAGVGCLVLALVPWGTLRSQSAIVQAQRALRAGDCAGTMRHALDASRALDVRPEPLELLAWCDVRAGQPGLAVAAADGAVRRDPGNWELRYTQALVLAVAGRDPRPAARAAQRRNPLHPYAQDVVRRFRADDRDRWRRLALEAPLPIAGG